MRGCRAEVAPVAAARAPSVGQPWPVMLLLGITSSGVQACRLRRDPGLELSRSRGVATRPVSALAFDLMIGVDSRVSRGAVEG
jgi:hypothetical protein